MRIHSLLATNFQNKVIHLEESLLIWGKAFHNSGFRILWCYILQNYIYKQFTANPYCHDSLTLGKNEFNKRLETAVSLFASELSMTLQESQKPPK